MFVVLTVINSILTKYFLVIIHSNLLSIIILPNYHMCSSSCNYYNIIHIPQLYRVCYLCDLEYSLFVSHGLPFSYTQSSNTSYPVLYYGSTVHFFSHPYIPNNTTLLVIILSRSREFERRLYHRSSAISQTNPTIHVLFVVSYAETRKNDLFNEYVKYGDVL